MIDWPAANAALAEYLADQEEIERQRELAEMNELHTQALIEDEQRTLAWEIVLDWAYAEDVAYVAPVAEEPTPDWSTFPDQEIREMFPPDGPEDPNELVNPDEPEDMAPAPVPVAPAPAPAPSLTSDLITQLRELKALHDEGVLDEDEFKAMKAAVIESMKQPVVAAVVSTDEGEPQLALAI